MVGVVTYEMCKENFVFGYSCFFGHLTSLHVALKSLLFGVWQSLYHGYYDLHLESDSLVLIKMIQGCLACPWRLQKDLDKFMRF